MNNLFNYFLFGLGKKTLRRQWSFKVPWFTLPPSLIDVRLLQLNLLHKKSLFAFAHRMLISLNVMWLGRQISSRWPKVWQRCFIHSPEMVRREREDRRNFYQHVHVYLELERGMDFLCKHPVAEVFFFTCSVAPVHKKGRVPPLTSEIIPSLTVLHPILPKSLMGESDSVYCPLSCNWRTIHRTCPH